ncbi:proton-conducting transporter transmembrane domain-containing protein [Sorangium atrum]|uniref:Proton-conducting transporter membrane subunit n=1 Tax=Sorangium atrum TaxID=2995308 RepID=A0ABT5BVD2_9BACT|nr:proton-conducting transporter membrane subunit [Sorangium aterium]MDC0676926.1 proton-conducting transporter membrane subunit [Sorangium aterium]
MTGSLLLSVPVLLVGAALSLGLRSNGARSAAAIASQAIAAALVLARVAPLLRGGEALEIVWPWPTPIDSMAFRVDALGAFFLAWSLPMTLLGTIYAVGYLRPYFDRGRNGGSHFALLNMVALSFVLIYSVQNALVFLLGWEIAALAAWLLVIWDYRNQKIRFAGFNYLISTHVGLFVLVAAFMLLHSKTDSMDFAVFGKFLSSQDPTRGTLFLLLGASFALKSAFFPFHTWLPRAHSAAPAHISALMSGVIHKAGLFAFLRFTLLMGRPDEWMGWSVLGFGALSAFFGVLSTSAERDLKRLLGYSSTENVGIAAMGFGVGYLGWAWGVPALTVCGFGGGLLHVLNHALFKCLLFYAAGAIYRAAHTVDLERLGGLARRLPRTSILFLIGSLAISALPPLNGFVSEFLIYAGLLAGRAPSSQGSVVTIAAAAALAFVGAVSALSMTRAFGLTFLGVPREPGLHVGEDAPGSMLWPMVIHAALVVAIGVAPDLGIAAIGAALRLFPIESSASTLPALLAPLAWASRALAGALLVAGVIGWRRGRAARRSVTWGCGTTATSSRMQYTGSSFSEQFTRFFASFLPSLRRERLPEGPFPQQPGHLSTHHVDAVERRMFEVLGHGENFIAQAFDRIPEQPRFAFAAGLVALVIIGAMVVGGVGR